MVFVIKLSRLPMRWDEVAHHPDVDGRWRADVILGSPHDRWKIARRWSRTFDPYGFSRTVSYYCNIIMGITKSYCSVIELPFNYIYCHAARTTIADAGAKFLAKYQWWTLAKPAERHAIRTGKSSAGDGAIEEIGWKKTIIVFGMYRNNVDLRGQHYVEWRGGYWSDAGTLS
jgi:hypothetical protein